MKFPKAFITAAHDYVATRNMSLETAVIIAGTNNGIKVFSAKQGVLRWTTPQMRDLENEGGVFVSEKEAKEVLKASLKRHSDDQTLYPDAQIILVKNLA